MAGIDIKEQLMQQSRELAEEVNENYIDNGDGTVRLKTDRDRRREQRQENREARRANRDGSGGEAVMNFLQGLFGNNGSDTPDSTPTQPAGKDNTLIFVVIAAVVVLVLVSK